MLILLRRSIVSLLAMVVITGIIYPLVVSAIGACIFPRKSQGSLIIKDGKVLGSKLIGQPFQDPKYFWSRPSATSPVPYNAAASSGSNLGPTNPALIDSVQKRIAALKAADPRNQLPIPADLVTASASGLDAHISPEAAQYQVARVARARGLTDQQVQQMVDQHTQNRQWGFLGEPCVNVLTLNLTLDETTK
jgi:K+-transporting ATPase ATPase C chain